MLPWSEKSRIVITCGKGIAPFLKEEILSAGLPLFSEGVAHIETEGTMDDAMRLNLFIRTGHRVLFLIKSFHVKNPDELYTKMLRIEWEDYIPEDGYLCVTSTVDTPTILDSRFANLKCKDAIVDRIKRKCRRRPDSGPRRDRSVIHLYWKDEVCFVYLDTSGEPLSKRGYRRVPVEAPMQETLAAAVILATGWNGDGNFVNPMCGSGTLAIEAALMALGRAPGLLRSNYGFMYLKGFDESYWKALRQKARGLSKKDLNWKIIASDINADATSAAKKNATTAGVEQWIEFRVCDYSESPVPGGEGVIILNPPYGERLGELKQLALLYKGIGDFLKKKCKGYMGYIFTGNPDLAKRVGLRTKKRLPFYNGNIECRLLEYDLYEGSRKGKS
jgi:putative N6-adenine-specific DNA methylase